MNKTKIKQQFVKWLTMFIAKPNKAFNNMPVCPYALQALQDFLDTVNHYG